MKPRTLTKSTRQIGKSDLKKDMKIKAMPPGKRISSTGNIYYEYRKNHTDVKGRDTPIRKVEVRKHTRNEGEIDVKKHDRELKSKQAPKGSSMNLNNFLDNKKESLTPNYTYWEDQVTTEIGFILDLTRGDAQSIIEANEFKLQQSWTKGLNPIDTAKVIANESKVKNYEAKKEAYENRKEAKLESAYKRLDKNKSIAKDNAFDKIYGEKNSGIPFGQPILVGHHSERRHRNALKRMDQRFEKGIEASNKASYYSNKIKNLENDTNGPIRSDDPDALTKISKKIKQLEDDREYMKKINAEFRKAKGDVSKMKSITEEEKDIYRIGKQIKGRYTAGDTSWDNSFFRGFELTSTGAEIRRLKQRQTQLSKLAQREDKEYQYNGVKIKEDTIGNRLRLHFNSIPDREFRTKLKRNGFRWSPYNKAWQKQLSNYPEVDVKHILDGYSE